MDKNQRDYFRELLYRQLRDLLEQADGTVSGLLQESGGQMPDITDRAAFESQLNFLLRIRDRESKLIKKIVEAIERLDDGTFGICEACGEEISPERLKARPMTTYCIDCKTRQERYEKASGL